MIVDIICWILEGHTVSVICIGRRELCLGGSLEQGLSNILENLKAIQLHPQLCVLTYKVDVMCVG